MRIVCQKITPRQWCAWIEGNPEYSFTGPGATAALRRLVDAVEGIDHCRIAPDNKRSTSRRYVFLIGDTCSDCLGSGTYTGLIETSDCQTCGGSGRIADDGLLQVPF